LAIAQAVVGLAAITSIAAIVVSAVAPGASQRSVSSSVPAADGQPEQTATDALNASRAVDIAVEVEAAVAQATAAADRADRAAEDARAVLQRARQVLRERTESVVRQRTPSGDVFEGEVENGQPQGYGLIRRADGGLGASFFIAGESQGVGAYCAKDTCQGPTYFGDYRHGAPTGFGVGAAADGGVYRGEFKAGAPDGYGVYRFRDGAIYRGGFLAGDRQGFGALTKPQGAVQAGFWAKNQLTIAGEAPPPETPQKAGP
jgi:hypothetical protein